MLKIIIAENFSILILIYIKIKWKHRNNNENTHGYVSADRSSKPISLNAGLSFNDNNNNNLKIWSGDQAGAVEDVPGGGEQEAGEHGADTQPAQRGEQVSQYFRGYWGVPEIPRFHLFEEKCAIKTKKFVG